MHQLHRVVVADVVDAVRRRAGGRVGAVRIPVGVGRGDVIAGADHPFHDVVDVREVAAHPAVVEHVNRLPLENGFCEQEHRHVGASPRPVHREEAQAGGGEPIQMAVRVRHELVRLLRGRVQRHRMVDVLVHRERHRGVRPVHAR